MWLQVRSRLISQRSKFVELIHLRKTNGERFINQEDVYQIEKELFGLDYYQISHQNAMDRFEEESRRESMTPQEFIKEDFNDAAYLKDVYEGKAYNILKIKDSNISKEDLDDISLTLQTEQPSKSYHPVIGKNNEKYIVEKLHARDIDFESLHSKLQNEIKSFIVTVD